MCGRYKLQDPEWVETDFSSVFPTLADAVRRPRYNVAPGQLVLAVTSGASGRALEQMRWGVEMPWKEGPSQMINARAEKIAESRFWQPMLESGRCALPADGFYEWKAATPGARKQPHLFTRTGGERFWLAGLATPVQGDRSRAECSNKCVIVTVAPNELVADAHDRMPAMLDDAGVETWLAGDEAEALAALTTFPAADMTAVPIGRAIGNAAAEGPELIAPVEPDGPAQSTLI